MKLYKLELEGATYINEFEDEKSFSPFFKKHLDKVVEVKDESEINKYQASIGEVDNRLNELKELLTKSDFKVLPDYDQDNTEIIANRKKWRAEVREIEESIEKAKQAELERIEQKRLDELKAIADKEAAEAQAIQDELDRIAEIERLQQEILELEAQGEEEPTQEKEV